MACAVDASVKHLAAGLGPATDPDGSLIDGPVLDACQHGLPVGVQGLKRRAFGHAAGRQRGTRVDGGRRRRFGGGALRTVMDAVGGPPRRVSIATAGVGSVPVLRG
eukprot:scaffold719_cov359-Prasinococcus_capsulatus_cf.AAC.13